MSPMNSESPTYLRRKSVIKKERAVKKGAKAKESSAKEIMARKAEILKEFIIDSLSGSKLLIIVENIYPIEEMNKILHKVIEVIANALSMSEDADPTHLITKYDAVVSTLSNVFDFKLDIADEFVEKIEAIKSGRYIDENNNPLILYRLAEGEREFNSRYVVFAVGRDVDLALEIIESRFGEPAVVFKARTDDVPSTYIVIMIPLSLEDLKNGPIEIPREYLDEIEKISSPPSEVKKDD